MSETSQTPHGIDSDVLKLVREPTVRKRFREMILKYTMSRWLILEPRRIWERRFLAHGDSIYRNPRFRDKEAGPPGPGWDWRSWPQHLHDDDWTSSVLKIEGWVPPNLLPENKHDPEFALPLCDRPRRLDEMYTILAAIHDHFCRGVEKIRPWQKLKRADGDNVDILVQSQYYRVLVDRDVPLLTDRHGPVLRAFLAEVEADLTAQGLGRVIVNGTSDAAAFAREFVGYACADTIAIDHGIQKSRLSEGKKAGKIGWKDAPSGMKDSQGRDVRILYHVADAKAFCSPKRIRGKV